VRIVHVTSYQVPGLGYEEIYLAREQKALGHEVTIVTSNYLHPAGDYAVLSGRFPQRKVAPCEEDLGDVRILRLASREIGGRVWMDGLERCIAQLRPDVVHCHNVLQFHPVRLSLMKAIFRKRFSLVVDEHMQTSLVRKSALGKLFYLFYGALAQPLIGHYVAHYSAKNESALRVMVTTYGIRGAIEIMTLGVDTERFAASPARRHEWRSRVGIPPDALLFLYTGKLTRTKGLHLLLGAAMKLLRDGIVIHVALVGDAEPAYLDALRRSVAEAGLEHYFHFEPSVEHNALPPVYAAADVGVWPSQETIAILEALSTSLPVIVNSSNGYAPIVTLGVGLLFQTDDESSLAQAMLDLTDHSRRMGMAVLGRDVVCRSYSWRQCAERYLDAYRRTLEPSTTGS
jgi:glycosyltransferase involved in cell wall biosynthesis